ncbi:MAG: FlgD immunoglobulin-like domain containing protein [Candidatus Krumholzibacteriia bacterium]
MRPSRCLQAVTPTLVLAALLMLGSTTSSEGSCFPSTQFIVLLQETEGLTITGAGEGAGMGNSVSFAGDVNGDGRDDVIIEAWITDEYYVVFGRSGGFGASFDVGDLDGTNGFTIHGGGFQDVANFTVSGAGDLNDDGVDDLVIGSPGSTGQITSGSAWVVFGRNTGFPDSVSVLSLDGTNGFTVLGDSLYDDLGAGVSSAGDFNNDGIDDLVIGAPGANVGDESSAGQAVVVFGTSTGFAASISPAMLDGSNGLVIQGATRFENLGESVSDAGDINDDGIEDLVMGASHARPDGKFGAGTACVVFGSDGAFPASLSVSTLDGTNGFVMAGVTSFDRAGRSVSGAGDVNHDGVDDVLVGAHLADRNGVSGAGECYIVFGKRTAFSDTVRLADLDGTQGFAVRGGLSRELGFSVSDAGDVNLDGIGDVVLGAPASLASIGEAYVVFGSGGGFGAVFDLSTLDGENGFAIRGIEGLLGASVSRAGDFNGDLVGDVIVGATLRTLPGLQSTGESYVIYGKSCQTVPVTISDLEVDATDAGVLLRWNLAAEDVRGVLGVRALRARDAAGPYLERGFVPTTATSFLDTDVEEGVTYWYRLGVVHVDGAEILSAEIQIDWVSATLRTALHSPFEITVEGEVRLRYSLARSSSGVQLGIYDIRGRRLRVLSEGARHRGVYTASWDRRDETGRPVARGLYLVRLHADREEAAAKLVLVRE